jgi:drug/metabolite transporter (DMT)-like permease
VAFFFILSPFIAHPFITEARTFPIVLISVLLSYGLISRFLLIFSYYESIERLPISTVSILSSLNVAGAILFAHLYLGEAVAWYHVVGVVFILAGATVVQWSSIHKLEERFVHFVKAHHRQQM